MSKILRGDIVINVILDPTKKLESGESLPPQYPAAGDLFIFEAYKNDKGQVSIGSPQTADRDRETGRASFSTSDYLDYSIFWGISVPALLAF